VFGSAKIARATIVIAHTGRARRRFFVASRTSHAPISAAPALPSVFLCQSVQLDSSLLQVGFMHASSECWQQRPLHADAVSVADSQPLRCFMHSARLYALSGRPLRRTSGRICCAHLHAGRVCKHGTSASRRYLQVMCTLCLHTDCAAPSHGLQWFCVVLLHFEVSTATCCCCSASQRRMFYR
jgi:hypothetical protein